MGTWGIAPLILDLGTIPGNSQQYVPVATMAPNISGSPVRTLLYVTFLAARILKCRLDFGKICAPLLGVHGTKAGWVPGSFQTVCRRYTQPLPLPMCASDCRHVRPAHCRLPFISRMEARSPNPDRFVRQAVTLVNQT